MPTLDKDMVDRARTALAGHVMAEAESRSFLFKTPGKGGAYHFRLVWTPGTLSLSGDIGELQVVHPYALARFEEGMYWLKSADAEYIFEKCPNYNKVHDPKATFEYIKEYLNRDVIVALNGEEYPWRGIPYRRHFTEGYRHELQVWRRECRQYREAGWSEEELPERPEDDPRTAPRREGWATEARIFGHNCSTDKLFLFADAWNPWRAVWRWDNSYYHPLYSNDHPTLVLDRTWRRAMLRRIKAECQDAHSASELCNALGFDDFYGCQSYPPTAAYLYEALQLAAREITASFTHTWGDPVC